MLSKANGGHNMEYEILFYRTAKGRSSVEEFLNSLDKQAQGDKKSYKLFEKIYFYLEVLEKYGPRAGFPYTKYIGDSLWELRPKDYRIFFFLWYENRIILLHCFQKKSQKTTKKEIEKARQRMDDWMKNGDKRL